jgi:NAD(P)-dependent dehydrogenase (short-subunit alcohol dehydrogenase family)
MKRVVVTGAAGGVGSACVKIFREAEFEVIGLDRQPSSDADIHLQFDVGRPDCGAALLDELGQMEVDGLVNNAAEALDKPATEISADDFDSVYAVNLRAPLLLASALQPRLAERGGFVVNVASVHAVATSESVAGYAATKGGLVAMTRALALEWAPEVRVNTILPGAVATQMLHEGLSRSGMTLQEMAGRQLLGRVADPVEIAEAIHFLAVNTFTTGTALIVDGGATARLSTE